jgi:membrane fusion protein (multidrug efflux system)
LRDILSTKQDNIKMKLIVQHKNTFLSLRSLSDIKIHRNQIKYSLPATLLLASILAVSCKTKSKEQNVPMKQIVPVEAVVATMEELTNNLEVHGSVLSNEMVELHPEVSGRLTYLYLPDGAAVKEGTLLARVNDAELQAQFEQQKTQLELATKTLKRLGDLLKVNGVNQADYDAALSQVNTIQANLKVIQAQIDKTTIKAPFSGELGIRVVSPGAYVTPQSILGTIHQTDKVKIDFTVPETFASLIEKGNKLKIQADGLADGLDAVITAIEPQINTVSRNIKVRALLTEGTMHPGAFVKVILKQNRKGIMVPTNAIIPDALSNQLVVVKNSKAQFVNVETGLRNANMVEITKGVNPGDTIVVSGMLFVRPNTTVKVKKVNKTSDKN